MGGGKEPGYKDFIIARVTEQKRRHGRSRSFRTLAKACRVQTTYLSKVLHHDGHLSREQLHLAAQHLEMSAVERDLLLWQMELERATTPAYRAEAERRVRELRRDLGKAERHINAATSDPSELAAYYLDPDVQLVHVFSTVERFARKPEMIAAALHLSIERLHAILRSLHVFGLVEWDGVRIRVLRDELHLAPDTAVFRAHKLLIRQRVLERIALVACRTTVSRRLQVLGRQTLSSTC